MRLTRRSKYGNTRVKIGNISFSSKKEAVRFQALEILQEGGAITDLKPHPRFDLTVNGIKVCTYIADASYTDAVNGTKRMVVEDTKALNTKTGKPIITESARIKHKLFKALYPQYEFEIYA